MPAKLAIVAHRGASSLAPENTRAAFTQALALGVAVIESDVRLSRDGALVLAHDDNLRRLTGRDERIADLDLATLRQIVVGTDPDLGDQTIATLDDVFQIVAGRARILLDLKLPSGHEAQLIDALRRGGAEQTVILGVRSLDALRAFQALAPYLATLAFGRTIDDVWALVEAGASIVRLWTPWVSDDTLARARQFGKPVWVMCGNPSDGSVGETTVEQVREHRRSGVEAVILNDPRLAIAANEGE